MRNVYNRRPGWGAEAEITSVRVGRDELTNAGWSQPTTATNLEQVPSDSCRLVSEAGISQSAEDGGT